MAEPEPRATIVRYSERERLTHWLIALSFLLAAASGFALFHPALFWLSTFLGGGPWNALLHPFIGLTMVAAFGVLAGGMWRHNLLEPRDWQWLRQIRDVLNNREDRLPEVGRYNAGQKLLFFTQCLCLTVLLLSGLVIWRAHFSQYFPIRFVRVCFVAHAAAGLALLLAIIGHVYAGFWIKGSMAAMLRGNVTPGWAWKHHRAWLRELVRAPGRH
jgi:formate dehydrogenase subunit gamma